MHPFQAFLATEHQIVAVDGVSFKLRRVTMEALAEIGVGMLLATQPAAPEGAAGIPSVAQLRASQNVLRAATCAAVIEVSADDGATWAAAKVVQVLPPGLTREAAAEQGILQVGDLPAATVQQIGAAAMNHATGGRAAREWLASFRRADAGAPGQDGEAVREAAQ